MLHCSALLFLHQAWERKINLIDSSAPLYVENLVDLEGPPTQMEYVNSYKVRTRVMWGGGVRGEDS